MAINAAIQVTNTVKAYLNTNKTELAKIVTGTFMPMMDSARIHGDVPTNPYPCDNNPPNSASVNAVTLMTNVSRIIGVNDPNLATLVTKADSVACPAGQNNPKGLVSVSAAIGFAGKELRDEINANNNPDVAKFNNTIQMIVRTSYSIRSACDAIKSSDKSQGNSCDTLSELLKRLIDGIYRGPLVGNPNLANLVNSLPGGKVYSTTELPLSNVQLPAFAPSQETTGTGLMPGQSGGNPAVLTTVHSYASAAGFLGGIHGIVHLSTPHMMIHHVNFLPTPESGDMWVIPSTVPLPPARAPFGCDSFFIPQHGKQVQLNLT